MAAIEVHRGVGFGGVYRSDGKPVALVWDGPSVLHVVCNPSNVGPWSCMIVNEWAEIPATADVVDAVADAAGVLQILVVER